MRLVTYQREGQARTGAQLDGQIIDLNRAYRAALRRAGNQDELAIADARVPTDMVGLLNGGHVSLRAAQIAIDFIKSQPESDARTLQQQGIVYTLDQVSFLPPVVRPGKVVCLGLNYRDHAAESHMEIPKYPVLFHKVAGSLLGHNQPIVIPPGTSQVDYEAELAIIIGKRGKYIAEADAFDYIAGYTNAHDVSARDLQFRTTQWTTGKMLDTFGPLGPALVTRDEIPDPGKLAIKLILNGQVMQDSNTAHMIFQVPFIISYLSQLVTLEPGDVIMTGTPPGIGNARTPPVFMQPGDTVTVEIEGLGQLTNPVVAEAH